MHVIAVNTVLVKPILSVTLPDQIDTVRIAHGSPLCHMVFSSVGKRDQHIKYSPAHAPPKEGQDQPAPEPTMDSITIYSGTKLFWRTRLNVELFMQQHKTANAVQVRSG